MSYIKSTQTGCRIVAGLFISLHLISCSSIDGRKATTSPPIASSTQSANRASSVGVSKAAAVNTPTLMGIPLIISGALNDTGIATSQCYEPGNIILVACSSEEAATQYNNADGLSGRDANEDTNDNADGRLGFSFTSVPASGNDPGSCVLDNVTGLMWEEKTADGGLRDKARVYTNYDSDLIPQKLDGSAPSLAEINAATNSIGFRNRVNAQGLCGFNDWRLPTVDELHGILDYGVPDPGPAIDTKWFPNSIGWMYWTASQMVDNPTYAWYIYFTYGSVTRGVRDLNSHVRLVRSAR